jgi:uncharacterized protein YuzE
MATHLTLQVDPGNHSIYIDLRPIEAREVLRTEQLEEGVLVDLGKRGKLLGVELLSAKAVTALFSRIGKESRLKPLEPLATKKSLLARLIA